MKPIITLLTCANKEEAQLITDALLDKKLVACVKWVTTTSHFVWNNKKESANEILLIMETAEEKYDAIHKQVKALHSYETFVLQTIPVTNMSDAALAWVKKVLD